MPFQTPSYGGLPIFGLVTSMQAMMNPTAQQLDQFFGVSGNLALFGGTRGRVFAIAGVFQEVDIPTLNADETAVRIFADGVARPLVDTRGQLWSNVIFTGEYVPDPMGPRPTDIGWSIAYRMTMRGLT